jgi:hypothetical protein
MNFLDIDDGRPRNFRRAGVIDMSSGNEVYKLEWDPRPHLIKPALSPSGHRIARVMAGILEVFQVSQRSPERWPLRFSGVESPRISMRWAL